jgi:hypothetical protein
VKNRAGEGIMVTQPNYIFVSVAHIPCTIFFFLLVTKNLSQYGSSLMHVLYPFLRVWPIFYVLGCAWLFLVWVITVDGNISMFPLDLDADQARLKLDANHE